MAETRIYAVTERATGAERLIEATNPAQALRFVAREQFAVRVPGVKVVAALMARGIKVEVADPAEPPQE